MPGSDYVTRADLEAQYTPDQVFRTFCDDGSTFNAAAFSGAVARASRYADSVLSRAWNDPAQRAALAADASVKACVATLVMHYGTCRRPEYLTGDMPRGPFAGAADEAKKDLNAIADGEMEPERAAGVAANQNVTGRLSNPWAVSSGPARFFVPTRGEPNPGGY